MHLIYLLVFKTTKVGESRVDKENVLNLIKMLDSVRVVLPHFFKFFLYEGFHINTKRLICFRKIKGIEIYKGFVV